MEDSKRDMIHNSIIHEMVCTNVATQVIPILIEVVLSYQAKNRKKINKTFWDDCRTALAEKGFYCRETTNYNKANVTIAINSKESIKLTDERYTGFRHSNYRHHTRAEQNIYVDGILDGDTPNWEGFVNELKKKLEYEKTELFKLAEAIATLDEVDKEYDRLKAEIDKFNNRLHHSISNFFRIRD